LVEKDADKVKVAKLVAAGTPSLEVLDLSERLKELVDFIRLANS